MLGVNAMLFALSAGGIFSEQNRQLFSQHFEHFGANRSRIVAVTG